MYATMATGHSCTVPRHLAIVVLAIVVGNRDIDANFGVNLFATPYSIQLERDRRVRIIELLVGES